MKTIKHTILTACLMLIAAISFSQYTFTGKVVDENDEPIMGAVIRYGENGGTLSDVDGSFSFNYETQKAQVVISTVGFQTINTILTASHQNDIQLKPDVDFIVCYATDYKVRPVFISEKYPVTESTVTAGQRESANLGQDIPILLEQLPSVVSTSDAGAGVGYSGIRVRGSDATRVNVTINGVPLNDSESQGVFWVNMPDFASSTGNMTLVRGVGTSTNGAGAFGASLHLETEELPTSGYVEYNGAVGSFNTWKNNIKFASGDKNGWSASGRLSKITSDGFIDRASSDLQSYFVQAQKKYGEDYTTGGSVKFITWKGHEKTYQAWYGVSEEQLKTSRTYNPYTYENQEDNYQQEHYQLLANQGLGENLRANVGLHYTIGKGYYEEFKEGQQLANYGISSPANTETDLVRRRWLDNDFYGAIASLDFTKEQHYLKIGGGVNQYLGDHFGEVIQGEFVPQEAIGRNYYFNDGEKNDANIYAKYTYDLVNGGATWRPFVDLQYRGVNYAFEGLALDGSGNVQPLPQKVSHSFFNPKLGLSYENNEHNAYLSFSRAQKEPNRGDYVDSPANKLPVPEELNDFELGYSFGDALNYNFSAAANLYYMDYKNQLAVTGGVNDVGAYTRVNVDDSYRAGIELESSYRFTNNFSIAANATFSQNKIKEFTENVDDYDVGGQQKVVHQDTDLALSPNAIAAGQIGYQTTDGLFAAKLIGKYVGKQFLDNTSTDSRSLDSYFVNNLNLTLDLGERIGQLKDVELNVLVNNLWNAEYESNGYTFGYIYGGDSIYENYYYPQAGRNFLAGLKVRF